MADRDPLSIRGLAIAVAVALRRPRDGKYLLVRRAAGTAAAGYWAPITGRVEVGESLPEAAAREAREEVGVCAQVGNEVYRCEAVGAAYMLVWFDAVTDDDALTLCTEEVAEARWVTTNEAQDLVPMFEATRFFYSSVAENGEPRR